MKTIQEIVDAVNRQQLDPLDRVEEAIAKLTRIEPLNAVRFLLADSARQTAITLRDRIQKGETFPLAGVIVAVKDNIVTKGDENTAASKILQGYHSPFDATAVERLRAAGAIILAKTNMDEFAMGSSGENSGYGLTRHPTHWNYVPGGSSSGSAVVVATGAVDISLGSETGGSVRQPASFCGIVGVKPSYGRISRYGLIAFASSLDQIGVFGKCVQDVELVLSVLGGMDEKDATSINKPFIRMHDVSFSPDKNKIAALDIPNKDAVQKEVRLAFENVLQKLQNNGITVETVSIPSFDLSVAMYYILATAEASANLARYDGGRYGTRIEKEGLRETYRATRGYGFGKEVKRRILMGTFVLSAGYYDAYYRKAMKARRKMSNEFFDVMKNFSVLLLPTSPTTAFQIGEKINDPISMYLSDIFTIPANAIGAPSVSIPIGKDENHLPIGMQVMAKPFEEAIMFRVAHWLETIL
ncbi:MAG: Asp-tRNA(Asn)/Glu-tRNA(Gln) amidotransferase subunit GatA [bacterium]|nr:Asp-tRNA(Asn)/Glu-tRNA(Gln) amidotransferase subunit GatA [bacterium]